MEVKVEAHPRRSTWPGRAPLWPGGPPHPTGTPACRSCAPRPTSKSRHARSHTWAAGPFTTGQQDHWSPVIPPAVACALGRGDSHGNAPSARTCRRARTWTGGGARRAHTFPLRMRTCDVRPGLTQMFSVNNTAVKGGNGELGVVRYSYKPPTDLLHPSTRPRHRCIPLWFAGPRNSPLG
jgi:hypothetical protein